MPSGKAWVGPDAILNNLRPPSRARRKARRNLSLLLGLPDWERLEGVAPRGDDRSTESCV